MKVRIPSSWGSIIDKYEAHLALVSYLAKIISDWHNSQDDPQYPLQTQIKGEIIGILLDNRHDINVAHPDSAIADYEDLVPIKFVNPEIKIWVSGDDEGSIHLYSTARTEKEGKGFNALLGTFELKTGAVKQIGFNCLFTSGDRRLIAEAVKELLNEQGEQAGSQKED